MRLLCIIVSVLLLLPSPSLMVKQEDFKKCDQSSFCVRQRAFADLVDLTATTSSYEIMAESVAVNQAAGVFSAQLLNTAGNVAFDLVLRTTLHGDGVRIQMHEHAPLKPRYEGSSTDFVTPPSSLPPVAFSSVNLEAGIHTLIFGDASRILIREYPFMITAYRENVAVFALNEDGYLSFEHTRSKEDGSDGSMFNETSNDSERLKKIKQDLTRGLWDESFGGKYDSKPNGKERRWRFWGKLGVFTIENVSVSLSLCHCLSRSSIRWCRHKLPWLTIHLRYSRTRLLIQP